MANNCDFTIRAVGKTKESVEKLLDVLQYKNPEMCLYRVFSAEKTKEGAEQDGDLWLLDIVGDVAWACSMWLHATDTGRPYAGTSKLAVLPEICKSLGIGVEIWAEEPGVGFEQHILVNHEGEIVADESEDMSYVCDDNGEWVENPDGSWKKEGGFENFLEFSFPSEIFG